jgi:hypothetical protein
MAENQRKVYSECVFQVFMLNEHFSQEHADAQHGGKESPNNRRYDWEDEFAITSKVDAIEIHENAVYPLAGTLPDGKEFRYDVPAMFLVEISSIDSDPVFVGVSQSILDHYETDLSGESCRIRIFIKDYEPLANPVPGVYIASKEFPEELVF